MTNMSSKELPATSSPKQIAVIGAGIAGLSCAYELQKAGHEVVVYEKNADVGGRMATRVKDGFEFNPGATFLSRHYTTLREYSKEFGILWTPLRGDRTHRVIRDGKAYPLGLKSPLEVLNLTVLSLRSRLRFLWFLIKLAVKKVPGDFFDLSTTSEVLDFDNASHYLRREIGDEAVDYIADPFTATLHFYLSDKVSTAMLLTLLKSMVGNKEFCAEYPKGGVQAIPNALAERLTVVTNADIASVSHSTTSNIAEWLVHVNGKQESFGVVVFACPAPAALKLLQAPTPAQQALLDSVSYGSTITLSFKVPADMFVDTTNCIYVPYVENKIIGSCIFEAHKDGLVRQGQTLFNVYLHDEAAKKLMDKSDAEVLATVLPELEKVCPEFARYRTSVEDPQLFDIERWPLAMPKFPHGQVTNIKKFQAEHQGENNAYFIGDYMNAPWTEGAAQSGKRCAALVDG